MAFNVNAALPSWAIGSLWHRPDFVTCDGVENNEARAYLYEYETRSPFPLAMPTSMQAPQLSSTADETPGGHGGNGFAAIREVHSAQTISGNAGALGLLLGDLPKDAEVNYTAPLLNFSNLSGVQGGGRFGGDSEFGLITQGAVPPSDLDNFALRAHGYISIPQGRGGQYTFNVNVDDSGELWIYGQAFEAVTNGTVTSHGSLAFGTGRRVASRPVYAASQVSRCLSNDALSLESPTPATPCDTRFLQPSCKMGEARFRL